MLALWAEMNVVVAEEFRDGNVPALKDPLRSIAMRICKKQQHLFAEGSQVKYFAARTNLWEWKPGRLLERHREKAGTIEAVHDVVKNELAGGVLPCGRYGANAASCVRMIKAASARKPCR